MEPYALLHFEKMQLKEVYSGEQHTEMPVNAFATTFFFNDQPDEPVAIFGANQILCGVFQVWAFTTESVKRHPIAFHREVVKLIEWWFDNAQLRRMQMSVRVGYAEGWDWAKLLGFQSEGTMRKYGKDGSDY